jgi:hypothetical protein
VWGGGFAILELGAGLWIGHFAERDRAEVGIFLAFRPWLLVLLALAVMRQRVANRWRIYVAAILLASGAEALLVAMLGSSSPWDEAARSVAASIAIAILFDFAVIFFARLPGRRGLALGGLAGLVLVVVPGPITLFERIALHRESAAPDVKPPLLLLTGLPLIWGEGGLSDALQGSVEPSGAYLVLAKSYEVEPIDEAASDVLAGSALLLVAQPRPPGPAGLVAIDAWVRDGGRILILTDPMLRWPSELALGDPRRPPGDDGLGPLLAHWGLKLEPPAGGKMLITRFIDEARIMFAAPGRFVPTNGRCRISDAGLLADCRIGKGRALLIADADMLHDLLWVGPGSIGKRRAGRLADNAAFLVAKLAELEGHDAPATSDRVDWIKRPDSMSRGTLAAFTLLGLCILAGLRLSSRPRAVVRRKDSDRLIHR